MKCENCSGEFDCAGKPGCWCFQLPSVSIEIASESCLCRSCLIAAIAKEVNNDVAMVLTEDRDKIANMGLPSKLREKIDYYINKDGNFVFTSWYFLRRGYCCENGCKHCPY